MVATCNVLLLKGNRIVESSMILAHIIKIRKREYLDSTLQLSQQTGWVYLEFMISMTSSSPASDCACTSSQSLNPFLPSIGHHFRQNIAQVPETST